MVLPSVEPRITKSNLWHANQSTHLEFFGETHAAEVSTGLILMKHFSDSGNVLFNSGMVDENGLHRDPGENGEHQKPAKKRRKKMQVVGSCRQLMVDYYWFNKLIAEAMAKPDYATRMQGWDSKCCAERNSSPHTTARTRLNMVPASHQGTDEQDTGYAKEFLMNSAIFRNFYLHQDQSAANSPDSPVIQL